MEAAPNELVERFRGGDKTAAVELIELCYGRIFNFLRRLAGNEADAADLTQQTFTRVWQALPSFANRSSVASWIHGIAYHVYVDWRRVGVRTESRPDEWWAACSANGDKPDEHAARNDLEGAVIARVEGLEADLRHTVHLHYYQGLTIQETADALGIATSTVKYRLRQALAELQKQLDPKPLISKATIATHVL